MNCILRRSSCCRLLNVSVRFCSAGKKSQYKIVRAYEDALESKFPRLYKVHRLITDGSVECWNDLKIYFLVSKQLRAGAEIESFERRSLQIYVQTPKNMLKLTVICVIVLMPMAVLLLAVAALLFPRFLLTRHFWTKKQKIKFWAAILNGRRQRHYGAIAASLGAILGQQLNLGSQAFNIAAVERLKPQFGQLQLADLPLGHKYHLCRSNSVLPLPGWNRRLERRARILAAIDAKIMNQGVQDLDEMALRYSLFIRQLNTEQLSLDEMRALLTKWCHMTRERQIFGLSKENWTFFLHAPVLLQLNEEISHS